jgi:hypothetical protein
MTELSLSGFIDSVAEQFAEATPIASVRQKAPVSLRPALWNSSASFDGVRRPTLPRHHVRCNPPRLVAGEQL